MRPIALITLCFALTVTAGLSLTGPARALPPREAPVLQWQDDGELLWYYINPGDINQDKLITVGDITPLALTLGRFYDQAGPFPISSLESVIDCNPDGWITVSDITPFGQNFDRGVDEYNLYSGTQADWPDGGTLVDTVPFSEVQGDPQAERVYFTYQPTGEPDGTWYWVVPVRLGVEGEASDPLEYAIAGQSGQIDIRLSSDGCSTGDLAVRLFAPASSAEHLTAGAPVAVLVPGGQDSHTVESAGIVGLEGFVNVSFSFPGVGIDPYASGGVDDSRGENVLLALRDVTRYCLGELTDTAGNTIQDITACNVLTDNVGIVALSNGGALATAALGYHGPAMQGLDWFAGWENPTCSQAVVTDAGPGLNRLNAPAGAPKVYHLNPEYNGWDPVEFDIDYSAIAYDAFPPDALQEMIYLERGGLPRFDIVTLPTGMMTSDLDGDDQIGAGEDWGFSFWEVDGLHYFSQPVIEAVWDAALFTAGSEPVWLPTVAEGEAFWAPREAAPYYDSLPTWFSGLRVILCCTEVDHVQAAADHPHIHQAFDGFNRNGIDVKLNPSPAVLIELAPALSGRTDLPDYGFGVEPVDWAVLDYCVPEDVMANIGAAAARELAELVAGG